MNKNSSSILPWLRKLVSCHSTRHQIVASVLQNRETIYSSDIVETTVYDHSLSFCFLYFSLPVLSTANGVVIESQVSLYEI